jgi:hypothetical protein
VLLGGEEIETPAAGWPPVLAVFCGCASRAAAELEQLALDLVVPQKWLLGGKPLDERGDQQQGAQAVRASGWRIAALADRYSGVL